MNDEPIHDVFGIAAVRELVQLINATDITEVSIERGDAKLHIKRASSAAPPMIISPAMAATLPHYANHANHAAPSGFVGDLPAMPAAPDARALPIGQVITSPMVGTFYTSASPKDPPFVREGDEVHTGDVVGIVEAMKIMNEIESEFAGRVLRIMVANGQPVEFGQPLFVIEPL